MKKESRRIPIFAFLEALILIGAFVLLFLRAQRGVELTDEGWYVAEPFLVSQGQLIPYVNNWTQSPGFSIPLALLFKVYAAIRGTEGIVLFSRVLYLVWLFAVTILTAFIVRKTFSPRLPMIWILPLLFSTYSLFDINYNTIGLTYQPLVIALVYSAWEAPEQSQLKTGIITGLLGARMIIGTPQTMIPCFLILFLLLALKKKHLALGLTLGVLAAAVAVVGWCCIRGGISSFVYGMRSWLTDSCYFKLPSLHTFSGDLHYLFNYLKPAYVFFAAALVLRLVFRKREDLFSLSAIVLIALFILYGAYGSRYQSPKPTLMIRYTWFQAFVLLFVKEKDKRHKALCLSVLLYFILFCFSSFTNVYGFGSRDYWLIVPMALSFLSVLLLVPYDLLDKISFPGCNAEKCGRIIRGTVNGCFLVLVVLVFLVQARSSYSRIYRDEKFSLLTERVESGIWKGCLTTEERKDAVTELEAYLSSATTSDDRVFFLDWASFGYLMTNGTACSSQTLDPCGFTYDCDYPRIIYDYYKQTGTVPTKIFYVDFGRDEKLSIEDPGWSFNEFVDSYYSHADTFVNGVFRVEEYTLKDEPAALAFAVSQALP